VNGNPVADGTPVHFSAVVSGMEVDVRTFVRWEVKDADIKPIMEYVGIDIPFEDINGNKVMDPNVDLTLDYNNSNAARGDDVNGDGTMDYSTATHDFFWWFQGSEPFWPDLWSYVYGDGTTGVDTVIDSSVVMVITPRIGAGGTSVSFDTTYRWRKDTTITAPALDSVPTIYADLNKNGKWDRSPAAVDRNNNGRYDGPASGDFEWWRWEMRTFFLGDRFNFTDNDYAVTVPAAIVTTKNGVAEAKVTYPRQMARRLYVTVNAEANGIRDKDGERFVLPIIR
jgi:hypothetical protein